MSQKVSLIIISTVLAIIFSQQGRANRLGKAEFEKLLDKAVTVDIDHGPNNTRLSVQYAVRAVCQAAGVRYNFEKSEDLADPQRRKYTAPIHVRNVPAKTIIRNIIAPVGLEYQIDESGLYLTKSTSQNMQRNSDPTPPAENRNDKAKRAQSSIDNSADTANSYYWQALNSALDHNMPMAEKIAFSIEFMQYEKEGRITDQKLIAAFNKVANKWNITSDEIKQTMQINDLIIEQKKLNPKRTEQIAWEADASVSASFLLRYYLAKFPDKSPRPFLEMASDKKNDEDFRKGMLYLFGDYDFYVLKSAHLGVFGGMMLGIAGDKDNSVDIRKKALNCIQAQLAQLENANKNDTQITQSINVIRNKETSIKNSL